MRILAVTLGIVLFLCLPADADTYPGLLPQLHAAVAVVRVLVDNVTATGIAVHVTTPFKGSLQPGAHLSVAWDQARQVSQTGRYGYFFATHMQAGMSTVLLLESKAGGWNILAACASTAKSDAPMAIRYDEFLRDYVALSAQSEAAPAQGLVERLVRNEVAPAGYFPDYDLGTDWLYETDWLRALPHVDAQGVNLVVSHLDRLRFLVQAPDPYRTEVAVNLALALPLTDRKLVARDLLAVLHRPRPQPAQSNNPRREMTLADAAYVAQGHVMETIPVLLERLMHPERPVRTFAEQETAPPSAVEEAQRWSL